MKNRIIPISAIACLLASPAAAQMMPPGPRLYGEIERLEYRSNEGDAAYLWDAQGWYGGDYHKLWLKSEGEGPFDGTVEAAEFQALYSRAVTPFFDLQAGIRHDIRPDPDRTHAVLGVQGLAPYWLEIDAAAFLSDTGDLTARIEAEYHLLFTQRLILQPRFELELAAQDAPELGVGSGLSHVEAGARLRYELRREFAPYIGVSWERSLGDTADFARREREDAGALSVVAGLRLWF